MVVGDVLCNGKGRWPHLPVEQSRNKRSRRSAQGRRKAAGSGFSVEAAGGGSGEGRGDVREEEEDEKKAQRQLRTRSCPLQPHAVLVDPPTRLLQVLPADSAGVRHPLTAGGSGRGRGRGRGRQTGTREPR